MVMSQRSKTLRCNIPSSELCVLIKLTHLQVHIWRVKTVLSPISRFQEFQTAWQRSRITMHKRRKTLNSNEPSKPRVVSPRPLAVAKSRAANRVKKMKSSPYPAIYYIMAEQRRYYSASDEVQDMMWEPYPAAYFHKARWQSFNEPKYQGMPQGGSFPFGNSFTTHSYTSGATDQEEEMDWQWSSSLLWKQHI